MRKTGLYLLKKYY